LSDNGFQDDGRAILAAARTLAELARREDLGERGDISTVCSGLSGGGSFRLVAKQVGVFAGRLITPVVLDVFGGGVEVVWSETGVDGGRVVLAPSDLALMRGPVDRILTTERTLLNFLQRLSGIATATADYVKAVEGTGARIYDTRKTIPGWRLLEKYAVRCGGGCSHRLGLYDAVMWKDNHLVTDRPLAGMVFDMLNRVSSLDPPPSFVCVEVDRLEQLAAVLSVLGVDVVLLDNFSVEMMRRAVELRDGLGLKEKVALEASGGITLKNVFEVAESGVERISVGAVTHSAPVLDLSLERES
jgi:nicotinate-nucleotide pyrophosphorylase (carboxylating)